MIETYIKELKKLKGKQESWNIIHNPHTIKYIQFIITKKKETNVKTDTHTHIRMQTRNILENVNKNGGNKPNGIKLKMI